MSRKSCYLMTVGLLSLALFSGEASADGAYKGCNGAFCPSYLPKDFYLGVFGGGGSANGTHASQRGTAFYPEDSAVGGPLAVDAEGNVSSNSTWFGGAHLGYAWNQCCWLVTPAIELEGFYLHSTLDGTLDAPHTALPEHAFNDSFPFGAKIFLANAVFTFNTGCPQFQVYLGGGIGGGTLSFSDASSFQESPPEPGINHFNTRKSGSDDVFAGQIKAGVSYEFCNCWSVFAEYRFLYLGPTQVTYGSTVAPGHVATSPWLVSIDTLHYNLGAVGVQFKL